MPTPDVSDTKGTAPEPVDLLVRAGFLFPVDGEHDVILDGEVAVRDGRIVHAGPARPNGHWAPRERLDRPGHALLPGFVNCHCHTASTVFRSQTDDGMGGGASTPWPSAARGGSARTTGAASPCSAASR